MAGNLFIIRHGQTEWNSLKLLQGQRDIPLNQAGREQARELAWALAGLRVTGIWSSDLSRARETADIIARKLGLPVLCDRRLREVDFGQWEGFSPETIQAKFGAQYSAWRKGELDAAPPQGESREKVLERIKQAVLEIAEAVDGGMGLIVTHGGSIRTLLFWAYEETPWQQLPPVPNGSLTRLTIECGQAKVIGNPGFLPDRLEFESGNR